MKQAGFTRIARLYNKKLIRIKLENKLVCFYLNLVV